MKKDNKDLNNKKLLAVTGCLLNILTEIPISNKKVVAVIDAIEKITPLTMDVWRGRIKIMVDGKTIFSWDNSI
jgi:hypothetical protein